MVNSKHVKATWRWKPMQWHPVAEGFTAYTKLLLNIHTFVCIYIWRIQMGILIILSARVRTSPRCPWVDVYTWRGGTVLMCPQEELCGCEATPPPPHPQCTRGPDPTHDPRKHPRHLNFKAVHSVYLTQACLFWKLLEKKKSVLLLLVFPWGSGQGSISPRMDPRA